jgi:hypothetical protein
VGEIELLFDPLKAAAVAVNCRAERGNVAL